MHSSFNKIQVSKAFLDGVKLWEFSVDQLALPGKPKTRKCNFFNLMKDAILKGYRPCKVCKPLEKLNETRNIFRKL